MKKKVLIYSLTYHPHPNGGAEPAIKEITNRLNNDYEFHMITLRYDAKLPKYEKYESIHIHRIGITKENFTWDLTQKFPLHLNKYYFQLFGFIKGVELQLKFKFDIVWAMMAHSCGIPAGLLKTTFPRIKYVLTLQEGDPIEHIESVARKIPFISWPLFKLGFTKADAIQAISYYLADWSKTLNKNVEPIIIKNGANPNDLNEKFSEEEVREMKNKLNKNVDDIFLVNTSRIVHQKGHDTVIKALAHLPNNYKYIIVGDGDKTDEYKELAENLNVSDRVVFTGRVDRSVVTLYRKASDICVAMSRSEGLGNAFVSALASRLPLVTTGVGGIADYAKDGVTAWITPVEDEEKLAEKILEVAANPEKVKQISETARKIVEEEYDWDKIAEQMKNKIFN